MDASSAETVPVLIAGAGPTGLVLALSLARRGVRLRVVSDAGGPGERSRAMVVHARTLEFYRQLGFARAVVDQGVKVEVAHVHEGGALGSREVFSVRFGDVGAGLSPYPFALAYPQDDHERLLLRKLEAAGVRVEWNARLTTFGQDAAGVRATIAHGDGREETVRADYLCGCDGARSTVRQALALPFPGGTYEQLYFVADVRIARGFDRDLHATLGKDVLVLMFPVRSGGMQRLIGLVPPEMSERKDLGFEDLRGRIEPFLGIRVAEVNWFSTYRVHHRVAERFRVGRAFLLGDAGHIHSPAGGQGMNTGIGDAVNLGWKLAQALRGRAAPALLDTYEAERIGFARALVETTDRAFTPLVAGGLKGEVTRRVLTPLLAGVATRFAAGRHALFRLVSQIRVHYPDSPLSEGAAGHVRGGDRLPWVGAADNFAPLRSLDWQVHVYGHVDAGLERLCGRLGLPVCAFGWSDEAREAGLARDAAYLVRPDGHVAVAAARGAAETIGAFANRFALRF